MHTNTILNLISQISKDEEILWAGKPHKTVLLLESIFNRNMIPAIIWGLMDYLVFVRILNNSQIGGLLIILLFIHLMPVWIYLSGILITYLAYQNTCYVITDKAIYLSTGIFKQVYEARPHTEIKKVTAKKSFFDNIYNLGDVSVSYKIKGLYTLTRNGIPLHNIEDYIKVYDLVLDLKTKGKEEIKQKKSNKTKERNDKN